MGSDTAEFGGEYHGRLALCPLAAGTPVPPATSGRLPGHLYSLGLHGDLLRRSFDGSAAGPPTVVAADIDWSRARGAFMVSGKLYTGWDDGRLEVRSFDGTNLGPPAELDLAGLAYRDFPVADLTGMFFADGRLYYSVLGERRLYYRYFNPESGIIGAEEFVASGEDDGLEWGDVSGLTLASGRVYYAPADGSLHQIDFAGGHPVPGSEAVIAGPGAGGEGTWASQGMFVFAG